MKNTIILILALSLTSCSTLQKVFHKNKSQIDSTYVTVDKKDSIVTNDVITIHKDSSKQESEIVIEFKDDSAVTITPKNSDDYFYYNSATGEIKASKVPKKVSIKGNSKAFNYDSLADHSKIEESELKQSETHLHKKEKDVVKEVRKKRTTGLWWLLLLIPAYIIYRNWAKIKAFILTILPI